MTCLEGRHPFIEKGKEELDFSCSLGTTINNIVESYALWTGLIIAKENRIKQLEVIEDMMTIL